MIEEQLKAKQLRLQEKAKKLIVIDLSVIPAEHKQYEDIEELRDIYSKMYPNYDFLFINTSRGNMEGALNYSPVYVI